MYVARGKAEKKKERARVKTHHLVDEPAAVLRALLGLGDAAVDLEVPVHVGGLLLPALLVRREPPPALAALGPQGLEEKRQEVWPIPVAHCFVSYQYLIIVMVVFTRAAK